MPNDVLHAAGPQLVSWPVNAVPDSQAEPTPLERQQILVAGPRQQTFWHRVRFELVAKLAGNAGSNVLLDIGAGAGLLGDWTIEHRPGIGYRFEELSSVLDAQLALRFGDARRSTPGEPINADTTVALLDVLEHIEDDRAALHQIRTRMAPGSRLVITVPALQWAYSSWDTELGHFRRYSRRGLRQLVTEVGLHVESTAYLFPELLPLLPLRKLRRAPRDHVDFPQLSPVVSRVGYRISTTTTMLRRLWPCGTSVMLTATAPYPYD